jgi:hypothetical protein
MGELSVPEEFWMESFLMRLIDITLAVKYRARATFVLSSLYIVELRGSHAV